MGDFHWKMKVFFWRSDNDYSKGGNGNKSQKNSITFACAELSYLKAKKGQRKAKEKASLGEKNFHSLGAFYSRAELSMANIFSWFLSLHS